MYLIKDKMQLLYEIGSSHLSYIHKPLAENKYIE